MAMAMFNLPPTPLTLLIVILTGCILSTRAEVPQCYYPNGKLAPFDYACNLTAEASFCCAIGYNCLDNKICTLADGEGLQKWNRGSCTDKNWDSPECPQFCKNFTPGGGSFLVNCHRWEGDKGNCCRDTTLFGEDAQDGCCTNLTAENPIFMLKGEATPFTVISSDAATQTRILPSSSSSSSTTATSTTSTSSTSSSVVDSSPSATPTPAAAASDPPPDSNLPTGAYVGVAIGVAAAIALLGAAIWLLRKRRRSNRQQPHSPMTPLVTPPWNSPGSFSHSKESGNVYEHRTNGVAELNELAAGNDRTPELRGETLLELEGNNVRR
jgi:LPXTG-motif cell wall-anchored protein